MKGEKKILYFDCSSGISGDMTLGALLDLGLDKELFLEELKKLHLDGYEIEFEKTQRNAITATHVIVKLKEDEHGHDYSQEHGHDHSCEHAHEHHHHHTHEHSHEHSHEHRSFLDIQKMITESELSEEVKDLALRIFTRVARAEAKVHQKPLEEVQFHEVGAVDSIVDIVGCAILINMLRPDEIHASVVQDGHGFIMCQHGMLSVPVPAVSEIFAEADVKMRQIDVDTELVTPTGAAIIAELASSFGIMGEMRIERIGWGAGTKILKIPNLLKVYLGSRQEEAFAGTETDEVMVLSTNLDDCTGEMLGYAMEVLFEAGALDVFYTPIYMKKNRPAWCLTVLAKEKDADRMEKLIFQHTTTIGIRRHKEERVKLKREEGKVQTPFGELKVKKVFVGEEMRCYPEYESAVSLAKANRETLRGIYKSYGEDGSVI